MFTASNAIIITVCAVLANTSLHPYSLTRVVEAVYSELRGGGTPTCEEGLHAGAVGQFDRRVSGVGGQSRVSAVIQKQPDDRKVVARHCVVKGSAGEGNSRRFQS